MQSAISISLSSPSPIPRSSAACPRSLRFCGLRKEAFCPDASPGATPLRLTTLNLRSQHSNLNAVFAALKGNGAPSSNAFDYDLVIIGAGVGGHGAALHAVEKVNLLVCDSCALFQISFRFLLLRHFWFACGLVIQYICNVVWWKNCFMDINKLYTTFLSPFLNLPSRHLWSNAGKIDTIN